MSWSEVLGNWREMASGLAVAIGISVFLTALVARKALVMWVWRARPRRKQKFGKRSLLLDLLMPMKKAKDVQANLEEMTPLWIVEHGKQWARMIRLAQILRIIVGHHLGPVVAFVERVIRIVRG